MLNNISFYGSLLKRDLGKGRKSTQTHVLLYGAIEAHSKGPKGCIASNNMLARDIGISKSRTETVLSEISQAKWVTIAKDKDGKRTQIIPNGSISFECGNPPLPLTATPLAAHGNIDIQLELQSPTEGVGKPTASTKKSNNSPDSLVDAASSGEGSAAPVAGPPKPPTIKALFYQVVKKYNLVITNHGHIPKWCKDLETAHGEDIAQLYLTRLLERDLVTEQGTMEYVPTLNTPFDIAAKSAKIIQYFTRTKDKVQPSKTVSTDYYNRVEEEAKRIRESGDAKAN
jgi:hypothetical protein